MRELPIIFSPAVAAANRANACAKSRQVKTQTRRVVGNGNTIGFSIKRSLLDFNKIHNNGLCGVKVSHSEDETFWRGQAIWQPGDLLYVKERHYVYGRWLYLKNEKTTTGLDKMRFFPMEGYPVRFDNDRPEGLMDQDEDYNREDWDNMLGYYTRNQLFMPKEYAKQWLMVKSVKAERLQDISVKDCIQEGIEFTHNSLFPDQDKAENNLYMDYLSDDPLHSFLSPKGSFKSLIESVNGKGIWEKNPMVWRIEYMPLSFDGRPDQQTIEIALDTIKS